MTSSQFEQTSALSDKKRPTADVVRGNWRSATGTYNYEAGDDDASVFFALSLEKAIFRPGIVTHANFRTAEFLRPGAEIEMNVVRTMKGSHGCSS